MKIGDWGAEKWILNWGRDYLVGCVVEFQMAIETLDSSDQIVSQFAHRAQTIVHSLYK